ncbi:MAG: hypothetical protein ABEJ27_04190 [Halodesulfurarchaeum sp.]
MTREERLECERCADTFALDQPHTEIVRRDFIDRPRPSKLEHLCLDCWEQYVEGFLDEEFEVSVA